MSERSRLRRWLIDYKNPDSPSSRIRQRRLATVRALISASAQTSAGDVTILDIGGTADYWRLIGLEFLISVRARVTLANLEPPPVPQDMTDVLFPRRLDGRDLGEIGDASFALGVSNSVIEHVGDWRDTAKFAAELRRVSRAYYVQTPNFWFPIEPHYVAPGFHWLPEAIRARLLLSGLARLEERPADLDQARRTVAGIRLLRTAQMRQLFPDAAHSIEWFFGLPKSLIAVRRA